MGHIVYPVYSRRSEGLSVGIDLFPDGKDCTFDCPYCELFTPSMSPGHRSTAPSFSLSLMEEELRETVVDGRVPSLGGDLVRDFCFSGSGEPTLSPSFPAALDLAARLRAELVPSASLVVITNGTRLFGPDSVAPLLVRAVQAAPRGFGLDPWIKVDAGTESWYRKIDRSIVPFDLLMDGIENYFATAAGTVQTMLCSIAGTPPDRDEELAWIERILRLVASGGVSRVHLYGKSRPAPEDPRADALPLAFLERRARLLRQALKGEGFSTPVSVFE